MYSNIKQCRNCSRIFESFGNTMCNDCTEEMDKYYILVRDYIYVHPDAEIAEISQKTGVKEKTILDFLKEQRLTLSGNNQSIINCEFCGKPILSGRYCSQCVEKLGEALDRAVVPVRTRETISEIKNESSLYRHILKNQRL